MTSVHLIYHGSKWKEQLANTWKSKLEKHGFECRISATLAKNDAENLAFDSNTNVIVAIGGDGTISECVNGIYKSKKEALFTFLAIGTGNDFSKSVKAIQSVEELIRTIEKNEIFEIDLIRLKTKNGIRVCSNICDIGLGGLVVKHVEEFRSKKVRLPYFKSIIKGFKGFATKEISITADQNIHELKPLLIAFGNGKYFGSGIGISPYAELSNGKIAVTVINEVSVLTYLKFLPKLKRLAIIDDPRISYFNASNVIIPPSNLFMEVDGESFNCTDGVDLDVLPKAIQILIPA